MCKAAVLPSAVFSTCTTNNGKDKVTDQGSRREVKVRVEVTAILKSSTIDNTLGPCLNKTCTS